MKRYPSLIVTPLFYFLLTLLLTYPLVLHLPTYVADTGDPLLNSWALAWGQHIFLQPWHSVSDWFNANAFYPYPYSLGFSEHLLLYAALTLPLLALKSGPIFSHNVALLFSLALAGWGMALLVTHWTKNQWAGLVAGVIFAFIPARLNHWAHLHQLSIHWMPFIILSLDRWLARKQWRDMALFGLFLNLQLLSTINYVPQTMILVGMFLVVRIAYCVIRTAYCVLRNKRYHATRNTQYAIRSTQHATRNTLVGSIVLLTTTILVNWPITRVYFELSELHGFERSLGDASIYGAALVDYITPPPENVLYGGWLTPRLADPARPLIPLFVGFVPTILAIIGVGMLGAMVVQRRLGGVGILRIAYSVKPTEHVTRDTRSFPGHKQRVTTIFLLLLTLLAILLSFGANESALGRNLSPLTRQLLFYRWLFEHVPGFSGLRVPARAAVLTFFGLAGLAGTGMNELRVAYCVRRTVPHAKPTQYATHNTQHATRNTQYASAIITLLIVLEYLAVPLHGTHVPVDGAIPPVYQHLASEPAGKVVLELPYDLAQNGANELPRLYYSSYGWYRLVNGASGFNPSGLLELSGEMQRFPDVTSLDVLRQVGVTHLVLHAAEFTPERWRDVWSKLPSFWSSVASVSQFGDDYLLTLRPPLCTAQVDSIAVQPTRTDGRLALSFKNSGPAAYFVDPRIINRIQAVNHTRRFVAPLFIPAGETRMVDLLSLPEHFDGKIALDLPALALKQDIALGETVPVTDLKSNGILPPQMPLDIKFGDDLRLSGYTLLARDGTNCRTAMLRLYWTTTQRDAEPQSPVEGHVKSVVRAVDRFGQTIASDTTYSGEWKDSGLSDRGVLIDDHRLPIVETTPAGQYGIMLGMFDRDGVAYPPSNVAGRLTVGSEVLLSDLFVRPTPSPADLPLRPVGVFENGVTLLGYQLDKTEVAPGDWLHLTLYWRTDQAHLPDFTVFAQLLAPDGHVVGQYDNPPCGGSYPTSLWLAGEVVSDDYLLSVNPTAAGDRVQLLIGMYQTSTMVRVPLKDGEVDYLVLTSLPVVRKTE